MRSKDSRVSKDNNKYISKTEDFKPSKLRLQSQKFFQTPQNIFTKSRDTIISSKEVCNSQLKTDRYV